MALTQISTSGIKDGTITNADIGSSAAIAGSKISPTFNTNITVENTSPSIQLTDTDHNSDFNISASAGNFVVRDTTNGQNRITLASNGTVDIQSNLDVGAGIDVTGNITATGHVALPDNSQLRLGTVDDLKIFHNGTDSIINTITGSLLYQYNGTTVALQTDTRLGFQDNKKASFGTGNDLEIVHNGADSIINNATNNLFIRSGSTHIQSLTGEDKIVAEADGAVELFHNNSKKFETKSTGGQITGQLQFADGGSSSGSNMVSFGSSDDLKIFHDGSNSRILSSTGELQIFTHNFRVLNDVGNEIILQGAANASC